MIKDLFSQKQTLSFEVFPPKKDDEFTNAQNVLHQLSELQPDFIASSLTQGLVFDRFEDKPKTIREWLYYSPLASPGIFLRFSSTPSELPVSTRFVVTMETNKKVLRDTSEVIHIVR